MLDWTDLISLAVVAAIAIAGAWLIGLATSLVLRAVGRKATWREVLVARTRTPFRVFVAVVLAWIGVAIVLSGQPWLPTVLHGALVVAVLAFTWLATGVVSFAFLAAASRYDLDVDDNRFARKVHTQLRVLRQVAVVIVWLIGIGGALLTFPAVQAFGASILASAGIASLVAGIAAQSLLGNVFAGVQLALTDAIRVDDVVIAAGEWGRIEDITLTYVVLHVWDDRRVVLPSTYFTTRPFENWTRRDSALLGSVMLDVDWTISPSAMRKQLHRIVEGHELWDGRTANVQVTDATGGTVAVRVLVSAANAGNLWDLRCAVREEMVEWVRRQKAGMPRTRVELVEPVSNSRRSADDGPEGVFTGSDEADERGKRFRAGDEDEAESPRT